MRFKHSGKLGDIIYGLPALKACRKTSLFLNVGGGLSFGQREAAQILSLLLRQPYIETAKVWEGEACDYDLDEFRHVSAEPMNLADAQLRVIGLSPLWRDEPWLTVDLPSRSGESVLFARSLTHRGVPGFWETCSRVFGEKALFVGSQIEHAEFCRVVGHVKHAATRNLLEVAELIAAAPLFVGNQSCPFAIAEGLKVKVIQETYGVANCVFERPDALYVRAAEDLDLIEPFACGGLAHTAQAGTFRPKSLKRKAKVVLK